MGRKIEVVEYQSQPNLVIDRLIGVTDIKKVNNYNSELKKLGYECLIGNGI
ncbi:GrpB family protein [Enterococcus quebecensis]|uniref:GrpB family protein n=1 Tax=Enterococcus quebecensis TaxID=903983 RepID=UPI000916A82E|nr:GrpB family protein [Enterococcus quebecensis]OJG72491.1 hypothetical protein RV12_GL000905 [Enterococcus quebecensis]